MVRFALSWQQTHVNVLNLLSSRVGWEGCVWILIPLNMKIKLPFCKIDSEWAKRVWQMENLSNSIESTPCLGHSCKFPWWVAYYAFMLS